MRAWAALVFVGLLLVGGLAAYNGAIADAGDNRLVTDEEFTNTDAGALVSVDKAGENSVYFTSNATVFDENGSEMQEGVDYEWYTNGTLQPLAGGELAGDASGTVTYEYNQVSDDQQEQAEFVAALFSNAGAIILVAAVVIFIAVARWAVA